LPFLVLESLVISAVLVWLNKRGAGATRSALVTLAVCIAVAGVPLFSLASHAPRLQIVQVALLYSVVPAAVLFALSRLGAFRARPWLLLFAGPVACVVALVIAVIAYNIAFASNQPR
jgi:hypothetical protein